MRIQFRNKKWIVDGRIVDWIAINGVEMDPYLPDDLLSIEQVISLGASLEIKYKDEEDSHEV